MCTTNKRRDRIKQKNNNNPKGDEKNGKLIRDQTTINTKTERR